MSRVNVAAGAMCAVLALTGMALGQAAAPASPSLAPSSPATMPWMNRELSPDARADLVIAQMTQAEQLQLVQGYFGIVLHLPWLRLPPARLRPLLPGASGFIQGVPRLGIPSLAETDAGVGVANNGHMRPGDQATALPSGVLNAATWDPQRAFDNGTVIGAEARDRAFNVVLDGAMNLTREPRGGRTFEYAGEDPLLSGTITGEMVRGLQSTHVISTVKHFALNDQETGRGVLNMVIDPAAARESDLLAFEIAIEHGDPGAVMCSYNHINGIFACENDWLLNQVLKHDWSYPGWVLSDWGGVHSTAKAAMAGLDQESASGFDTQEFFGAPFPKALADGSITPERFHDMLHRILRSMFANGLMDYPAAKTKSDLTPHLAIARSDAEEGIVLLKNAGNALPLAAGAHSVAVIGAHADIGMLSGGGSSQVVPIGNNPAQEYPVGGPVYILPNGAPILPTTAKIYDPPSPVAALKAHGARVVYDEGQDIDKAVKAAKGADVAIIFAEQWSQEGQDLPNLSLPGQQDALIAAVAAANPHTVVVLETGGPVTMPWLDKVPAVVEAWYAGNRGAEALTRILYGDVDPSGRLPLTFPASESQLPRPQIPGLANSRVEFDVPNPEGADVGYRWFEKQNLTPLFPFGYGLSYTHFTLGALSASADGSSATVGVTNDGPREGLATVELYATPPDPGSVARLVGFAKVDLKPGETKQASLTIEPRLLALFDDKSGQWHIAGGPYALAAGFSSAALDSKATVILPARDIKP